MVLSLVFCAASDLPRCLVDFKIFLSVPFLSQMKGDSSDFQVGVVAGSSWEGKSIWYTFLSQLGCKVKQYCLVPQKEVNACHEGRHQRLLFYTTYVPIG